MRIKTDYIFFALIFIFFIGCQDKKEPVEIYVAEVGDSKLAQSELERELGDNLNISKFRDEYIKDWIETELLLQISIKNNLLNEQNYKQIIKNSERELAASIAINDYLISNPIAIDDIELLKYFDENKSDYYFSSDSYLINLAEFKNEESAIFFRDQAIRHDWDRAIEKFADDSSLVLNFENRLIRLPEIQSEKILRVLKKLYKDEISFVINTELNNFVVVQQLDEIVKNSAPRFEYVKDNVKSSLIVLKQREQVRLLLDSLINQKNVKIY